MHRTTNFVSNEFFKKSWWLRLILPIGHPVWKSIKGERLTEQDAAGLRIPIRIGQSITAGPERAGGRKVVLPR
jgi:hypothetical protein